MIAMRLRPKPVWRAVSGAERFEAPIRPIVGCPPVLPTPSASGTGVGVQRAIPVTLPQGSGEGVWRKREGVRRGATPHAHQCKWGRPEGRPHSHRRVDPRRDTWRPVSLPLVSTPKNGRRGLCHRRSHRHPVPSDGLGLAAPGRSPSLPFPLHPAVPRPVFRDGLPPGAGTLSGRSLRRRLLGERPGETGRWLRCFAFLSNDPLAPGRSPLHGDLEDRADSCRHLDRV